MTIEEYLERPKLLKAERDRLRVKIEVLRTAATSAGDAIITTEGRTSYRGNRLETKYIELADTREDYIAAYEDYIKSWQKTFAVLMELPPEESAALIQRFLYCKTIKDICDSWPEFFNNRTVTPNWLYTYLNRGKRHLRELLQNKGVNIE